MNGLVGRNGLCQIEGSGRLNNPNHLNDAPIADPQLARRLLRFSHKAMATNFELCVLNEEAMEARLAGNAAFEEIDRLEQELSYFIPYSDVSRINALAAGQSVRVSAETFECLSIAKEIHEQTSGAFDPTVGAVLTGRRPWDEDEDIPIGGTPPPVSDQAVAVGMEQVSLNSDLLAVGVTADGVEIDLGGIGKGYALDRAVRVLVDWGITTALLHCGQSTMVPIGHAEPYGGWPMRFLNPVNEKEEMGHFCLRDAVVSCSVADASGHILDPQSGEPVARWLGAWAIAPTAAVADALSTAFSVMGAKEVDQFCRDHPEISAMLVEPEKDRPVLRAFGDWTRFDFKAAH